MANLDNLFKRISDLGLNAKKVSEATGISTGNISDWKSGRSMPSAAKLDILADYLDVPVDYLLGRGVFANWDRVMANKQHIIGAIEASSEYAKKLDLENQPEIALMYFLSALFAKIDISDDNEEIGLYPYIPPSRFDEVFKSAPEELEE